MIRGAIFDLDGTLLDSMPYWKHAGEIYLKTLGVTASPGLSKVFYASTMQETAEYLRTHYCLPLLPEEIMEGLNRTVENFYYWDAPLKPGVLPFLLGLREHGIAMMIATVTDRHCVEAALTRLGIDSFFCGILTTTEVGVGKKQPDIYLRAADEIGTTPAQTLVFEDALHAAQTAARAGFVCVGVYDEASSELQADLMASCQYYLRNFENFPTFAASALT